VMRCKLAFYRTTSMIREELKRRHGWTLSLSRVHQLLQRAEEKLRKRLRSPFKAWLEAQ